MAQGGGLPTPAGRTWRAYLSMPAQGGQPAVNARDRIGAGPWHNARGALIANNVADLHGDVQRDRNQINKSNALNEKGAVVNGVGDMPNQHDILTGSDSLGRAIAGDADTTCKGYTSNADGPRQRHARASRSRRRREHVVEFRARIARLQPAQSGGDGRRGLALLLRGQLIVRTFGRSDRSGVRTFVFGSFGRSHAERFERFERTERFERSILRSASRRAAAGQA
jgi:hypothetical protein